MHNNQNTIDYEKILQEITAQAEHLVDVKHPPKILHDVSFFHTTESGTTSHASSKIENKYANTRRDTEKDK